MFNLRSQLDKIIITAMDRFVWFVLLIVMSHVVTEFTRVNGYGRGNRHDAVLVNDSALKSMSMANMIIYPSEQHGQYSSINMNSNNNKVEIEFDNDNNNNNNNNNKIDIQSNTANRVEPRADEQTAAAIGSPINFHPLIDSIFEIPISTLRTIHKLVADLTSSYQRQVPTMAVNVLKSTNGNMNAGAMQAFRSLFAGVEEVTSATTGTREETATTRPTSTPTLTSPASPVITGAQSSQNNNYNKKNSNRVVFAGKSVLREVCA